jgi:hypothetical protein
MMMDLDAMASFRQHRKDLALLSAGIPQAVIPGLEACPGLDPGESSDFLSGSGFSLSQE